MRLSVKILEILNICQLISVGNPELHRLQGWILVNPGNDSNIIKVLGLVKIQKNYSTLQGVDYRYNNKY